MANLLGQNIGTNYKGILNLGSTINTPVSGTLQAITDGDGLASALNVSTTSVAVSGTLEVTGDFSIADKIVHIGDTNTAIRFPAADTIAFETGGAEAVRVTSEGRVGIGTTSITSLLTVGNAYVGAAWEPLRSTGSPSLLATGGQNSICRFIGGSYNTASSTSIDLSCAVSKNLGIADTGFRISANTLALGVGTSDGFLAFDSLTATVGGTFTTQRRLRLDADGLKFGSDTAAANALDDYEEGTWTMGVAFGGAAVGVTYTANTGTYTKIGRQVSISGNMVLSSKGSSAGAASITGLPFTSSSLSSFRSAASLRLSNVAFANAFQAPNNPNTTEIALSQITEAGVDSSITNVELANNSNIIVSMTYFV
jgi:hypothetical protein